MSLWIFYISLLSVSWVLLWALHKIGYFAGVKKTQSEQETIHMVLWKAKVSMSATCSQNNSKTKLQRRSTSKWGTHLTFEQKALRGSKKKNINLLSQCNIYWQNQIFQLSNNLGVHRLRGLVYWKSHFCTLLLANLVCIFMSAAQGNFLLLYPYTEICQIICSNHKGTLSKIKGSLLKTSLVLLEEMNIVRVLNWDGLVFKSLRKL